MDAPTKPTTRKLDSGLAAWLVWAFEDDYAGRPVPETCAEHRAYLRDCFTQVTRAADGSIWFDPAKVGPVGRFRTDLTPREQRYIKMVGIDVGAGPREWADALYAFVTDESKTGRRTALLVVYGALELEELPVGRMPWSRQKVEAESMPC